MTEREHPARQADPRFGRAQARAKAQIRRGADDQLRRQLGGLLQNAGKTYLERMVIRESGRISFMKVAEIRFIEAQGNYARIHGDGEAHLVRRRSCCLRSRAARSAAGISSLV